MSKQGLIVPASRVAGRVIDGTALILDLGNAELQRLNAVGSFVWARIAERRHQFDEICQAVVDAFDVSQDQAVADLTDFLQELEARGLIAYKTD